MSTASLQPSPAAAQTPAPVPTPNPAPAAASARAPHAPAAAHPQPPEPLPPPQPRLTHEELYQLHLESIARTNRFIARTVRDCRRYFVDVAQGRAPLCPDRLKGALIGSRCRFLTMPRPARPRRSADMDDEDFFPSPPPPARPSSPSRPTRPSQPSDYSGPSGLSRPSGTAAAATTSGPGPSADAPRLPRPTSTNATGSTPSARTAPGPTKPAPAAAPDLPPEAAAERARLEDKLTNLSPRYEELHARLDKAKTPTDRLYHQRRLDEFESTRLMPLVNRLVALGSDLIPDELRPNADPTPNPSSPSAAA